MKAYQLISAYTSYDEGWVETVINTYSSKEEAEKAKNISGVQLSGVHTSIPKQLASVKEY